jgi:signal transduction histidine kinase
MIILLWITGGYFIYNLSGRSAAMLKENYQTVESAKFLIQSLDEIKNQQLLFFFAKQGSDDETIYTQNFKIFNENLTAAENNITEEGEQKIIDDLKSGYSTYISTYNKIKNANRQDAEIFFAELIPEYTQTQNQIIKLWDTNMKAISHKNNLLKSTAHRAFVLISIVGAACFFISAFFFFRYPGSITRPLSELITGIEEIANRNYDQRLDFHSKDELGQLAGAFNTMAAKLDEYEHSNLSELLFEKKRIETIINNMKDGIIGLNEKNEIIFSNANACEILKINEDELVGKYARDIAVKNEIFKNIIHDIIENPDDGHREFKPIRITSEDQVNYFARETLNVVITKTGEVKSLRVGVVVVLKNITRFLEQDEAKTNFMATISHELKTPISSLRLNLKLLDDERVGILNQEQQEIVKALKSETNKMLTITSELLDLARLETGNIRLNLQKVYVEDMFEYIKEAAAGQARAKNVGLRFQAEISLPPVKADSEKTAFALINLINNAIQYSDQGSDVIISARKHANEILFMVEDFGKGIDNQYFNKIFEKFFRIPGSEVHGTGLGLAITKEFITKQKGRIWPESTPGKGSRFYFTLPVYT